MTKNNQIVKHTKMPVFRKYGLVLLIVLFGGFNLLSQSEPKIVAEIDTTFIKIGDQIQYRITVETDTLDIIHLPKGQTFSPLETVEAITADSSVNKSRLTLQRVYALTQFDSGAYTIPPQRIAINEREFFTDSFRINVATVPVDTVKQKLYDIKPLRNVDKNYAKIWNVLLWLIPLLLLIGGAVYWFFLRKKPLTEEEEIALLPAYDRALLELKKLESSKYLINDEYKKYYSELTDIVRSYLEEDVNVSALESTTEQLIERLELLKNSGELELDHPTIDQFKAVLRTADLVKFAKSKPPTNKAESDRKAVEDIVIKTKEALPEPTAEELQQTAEFLEEQARLKRRKTIYVAAASFVGLILFTVGLSIAYYGAKTVKDTVFGHPTKELLEGEWVKSLYGYPPIELQTPDVLVRQDIELGTDVQEKIASLNAFAYGRPLSNFSISASSTTFKDPMQDPDFKKSISQFIIELERRGAKNLITKQEEFITKSGVTGLKTYGSGQVNLPKSDKTKKGKYLILSFGGKGFQQQIAITWDNEDTYAEEIVAKILSSMDVKTQA